MNEDYAKVDAYLNGYRAAINAAFCPETGWFWKTLGDVQARVLPDATADDFYDEVVEAVNEELGR